MELIQLSESLGIDLHTLKVCLISLVGISHAFFAHLCNSYTRGQMNHILFFAFLPLTAISLFALGLSLGNIAATLYIMFPMILFKHILFKEPFSISFCKLAAAPLALVVLICSYLLLHSHA